MDNGCSDPFAVYWILLYGKYIPRASGRYKLIETRQKTIVVAPDGKEKVFRFGHYSARKWRALKWIDERERMIANACDD